MYCLNQNPPGLKIFLFDLQGSGPQAGTIIADIGDSTGVVVHRASLLRELLSPLPSSLLHANKKLSGIQESSPSEAGTGALPVSVRFEDGTASDFDAVIGADGIFSSVRAHVLRLPEGGGGSPDHEHAASPAGFWDCRVMIPYEKAKAALGEQYFDEDRQYGWIGDRAFVMHDIAESRTMVQCVISAVEDEGEAPADRKRKLTREYLEDILKGWLGGPIGDGAIEVSFSLFNQNSTDPS